LHAGTSNSRCQSKDGFRALKAGKRAELAQKLATIADMRVETELKVGRVTNGSKERGSSKLET